MPTAGLPVASTITSILSPVALAPSAVKVVADIRASSQPTVRQASRARSGSRSTMTGTSRPGVCGTCDRNIEPNLPAPISATRTGFPAARRALSRRCRFMADEALFRCLALRPREPEQGIIRHGLDRREIAVSDVFGPRRGADVVRDRVQCQIDDLARIGRDVAGRAVPQIAMENQ